MMPARFLWSWEVFVSGISELEQEPEVKRKCQVAVVDIPVHSILLSNNPLLLQGDLDIDYVPRH